MCRAYGASENVIAPAKMCSARSTAAQGSLLGVRYLLLLCQLERNAERSMLNVESNSQRVRGIEPPCAAWEAAVLPLNYTRTEQE